MNTGSRQAGLSPLSIVIAALLALCTARAARAQTTPEPVDLSYRAPQECPSFDEFLTEVQRSTPRLRLAKPGATARRFDVVIEPDGRVGHLAVDGGAKGVRDAHGADCAEVSRLLAFATALAADPDAQPPDALRDTRRGADGSVAAFPSSIPASAAPPAASTPTQPHGEAPARDVPEVTRTPSAAFATKWSAAGFGFVKGASAPDLTWGGGAFAGLELSSLFLAPSLRVGAGYDASTVTVEPTGATSPGSVKLSNYLMTLEVCSGALKSVTLVALPCLRAQGGARVAAGHDLPQPTGKTRPFLELGLAGHVRWRFAGRFFAELGGALLFPTIRDRIVLDEPKGQPTQVVDEKHKVGGLGELALGFEFGDQSSN
jgi:hypothetical protein